MVKPPKNFSDLMLSCETRISLCLTTSNCAGYRIQSVLGLSASVLAGRHQHGHADDPGPGQPRQTFKDQIVLVSLGAPPLLVTVQYQHISAMPGA